MLFGVGEGLVRHDRPGSVFDLVEHFCNVRAANLINADLAYPWFPQPIKALSRSSAQRRGLLLLRTYRVMNSSSIEATFLLAVNAIFNRVLPSIYALAQIASFSDSFEGRPIRPTPDRQAMFAAAQAVVENKSTRASRGYADTEAARNGYPLDHVSCEVRDAIAAAGTDNRLTVSSLSFLA